VRRCQRESDRPSHLGERRVRREVLRSNLCLVASCYSPNPFFSGQGTVCQTKSIVLVQSEIVGDVSMPEAFLGTPTDPEAGQQGPLVIVDIRNVMGLAAFINGGLQFAGNALRVLFVDGRHVESFSASGLEGHSIDARVPCQAFPSAPCGAAQTG